MQHSCMAILGADGHQPVRYCMDLSMWRYRLCLCLCACATLLLLRHPTALRTTASVARRIRPHRQESHPDIWGRPPACADANFSEANWAFVQKGWDVSPSSSVMGSPSHRDLRLTNSQRLISLACSDLFVSTGEICEILQQQGLRHLPHGGADSAVDIAISFVEDEPHWKEWKQHLSGRGITGLRSSNFRSFNQIQYAFRSVLRHLPWVKMVALVAPALPASRPPSGNWTCSVMQTPSWLNVAATRRYDSQVQIIPHTDIFPSGDPEISEDSHFLQDPYLPTFNSRAIESRFTAINTSADVIVYLNDDFALGQDMTPSDFATHFFGPVLRLAQEGWIEGAHGEHAHKFNAETRSRNAHVTEGLLDMRFGKRERSKLVHLAYTLPTALMHEASIVWGNEMETTASSRFRGAKSEASLPMLATLYTVEKHREALLWSFLVAASDWDGSGHLDEEERREILRIINGNYANGKFYFNEPFRPSSRSPALHFDKLARAGASQPRATRYIWSSSNGYPYLGNTRSTLSPKLDGKTKKFCSMPLEKCFINSTFFDFDTANVDTVANVKRAPREPFASPERLFTNMAFEKPSCGDCLIAALLTASGEDGLEAFLPMADTWAERRESSRRLSQTTVPFIGGFTPHWNNSDYSFRGTLGLQWRPRDFAVRLIQRYAYVIGESPHHFGHLRGDAGRTARLLEAIESKRPAFIGLNDDIPEDAPIEAVKQTHRLLTEFHERMWPSRSRYEF